MKIPEQIEELKFEKNYTDFTEFLEDCKDSIYRKLFLVFEEMYSSSLKEGRLVVFATVGEVTFDSVFNVTVADTSLLTGVLLEYFKDIEEYETCSKILKMCS